MVSELTQRRGSRTEVDPGNGEFGDTFCQESGGCNVLDQEPCQTQYRVAAHSNAFFTTFSTHNTANSSSILIENNLMVRYPYLIKQMLIILQA